MLQATRETASAAVEYRFRSARPEVYCREHRRRAVIGRFDGGRITSDGGGLLCEVDKRLGLGGSTGRVFRRLSQSQCRRAQRIGPGGATRVWPGAGLQRSRLARMQQPPRSIDSTLSCVRRR